MKKRTFLLALVLIISVATTVNAASEAIKAYLFKGTIVINNKPVELEDMPLLNYNGRTYVPLRAFSGWASADVGYDKGSQTVYVDYPSHLPVKSEMNQKNSNEDFKLHIFSEKAVYAEGEPIRIWSRLSNENDHPVTVIHSGPFVGYDIKDEEGFEHNQIYAFYAMPVTLNPGDESSSSLSSSYFAMYNANKNGMNAEIIKYLNETARPSMLSKGTYTITAVANYSRTQNDIVGSKVLLKTSITITVK